MSAEKLSKEALANLQEGFELYDPDRTGQLPVEDLPKVARACGANPTEGDLQDFFEDFADEFIDFESFVEFMVAHTKHRDEGELRKLFQIYDAQGEGKIVAAEMKHALRAVGDVLSEDEVGAMLQEVGVDKDGNINYDDFIRVMARRP